MADAGNSLHPDRRTPVPGLAECNLHTLWSPAHNLFLLIHRLLPLRFQHVVPGLRQLRSSVTLQKMLLFLLQLFLLSFLLHCCNYSKCLFHNVFSPLVLKTFYYRKQLSCLSNQTSFIGFSYLPPWKISCRSPEWSEPKPPAVRLQPTWGLADNGNNRSWWQWRQGRLLR